MFSKVSSDLGVNLGKDSRCVCECTQSDARLDRESVRVSVSNASRLLTAGVCGRGREYTSHCGSCSTGSRLLNMLVTHDSGRELGLRFVETGASTAVDTMDL